MNLNLLNNFLFHVWSIKNKIKLRKCKNIKRKKMEESVYKLLKLFKSNWRMRESLRTKLNHFTNFKD